MVARSLGTDLDRLLKLRLVVGRFGEMDLARWWNTNGILGRHGAVVLKRSFPATHYFAQAHVVFEVARSRSRELFNPPGCMTLWNLPAEVEDAFEERWQTWLDERDRWAPVFESLAAMSGRALLEREYAEQLSGTFDIRLDGTVADAPGAHLDDGQRLVRAKLVAAVEHLRAAGHGKDAVHAYVREAAFTTLNRFVALKMLEARSIVQECLSRGEESSGFKEFVGLAPGLA